MSRARLVRRGNMVAMSLFIQNTIIPAIRTIAQGAGVSLIDNNTEFLDHPEVFSDGVHPTTQGAGMLADNVAAAVTAQ